MKIKDERVKQTSEILGGIKVLKLYAWEPSFEQDVLQTRAKEMKILLSIAMYNAASYFIWSLAPFLISMASFIHFVLMGRVLTPEIAFVSLALFNILRCMRIQELRPKFCHYFHFSSHDIHANVAELSDAVNCSNQAN